MEESPGEEEGVIKKKVLEVARFGEEKKKGTNYLQKGKLLPFSQEKLCVEPLT